MSVVKQYASAIAVVLAAVALRWQLIPWIGPDVPFATLLGSVAIAVWMAGWAPATAAAVLGFICTALAIGRPMGILPVDRVHTALGIALYALTCALIIGLGEAMRRTRDAYRRSQERFLRSQEAAIQGFGLLKTVRDAAGDCVDFEFEYINPLGAALRNSKPERIVGFRLTAIMPGACAAGLLRAVREVVQTGKPVDIELADETGATPVWLRYMLVKVEDGVAMSFSDITQTKQLSVELKRRAVDLQRANAIKSLFLATLAHELRNPLAPIRNGLAILKDRVPGELDDIADMMERQMRLATRLIDDLLDASRIDRGTLELRREVITLDSFVNAAIETARPNIEAKSHELIVHAAPHTAYVDGDPTRLAQVLANLLNNAAKFTPVGGRIIISVRAKEGHAVIRVQDNGIGIAPTDLDAIFDMFVQLDASKSQGSAGLGLGLALSRSLISLHSGEITARSAGVGKGSDFRIRLPLVAAPARRPAEVKTTASIASRRILVVDDNVDAATSLATLLQHRGHRVQTCFDGITAFEIAARTPPDIAFIDLNMPQPDGIELARMIRAQPWGQAIKLIALTGMGQPGDLQRTHAAGFDTHLLKPVSREELMAAMATLRAQGDAVREVAELRAVR